MQRKYNFSSVPGLEPRIAGQETHTLPRCNAFQTFLTVNGACRWRSWTRIYPVAEQSHCPYQPIFHLGSNVVFTSIGATFLQFILLTAVVDLRHLKFGEKNLLFMRLGVYQERKQIYSTAEKNVIIQKLKIWSNFQLIISQVGQIQTQGKSTRNSKFL